MIKKVRKILEEEGHSFYWLSKETGISESTLQNYRNGTQVTWDNACKIADALGVSLDNLR